MGWLGWGLHYCVVVDAAVDEDATGFGFALAVEAVDSEGLRGVS